MNVISSLLLVFILLVVLILGRSSFFVLSGLFMNILLFFLLIFCLHLGLSVYLAALAYILLNSLITLGYVNGWNEKTKVAFYSLILFSFIVSLIFIPFIQKISISGFSSQELEELAAFNLNVPVSFTQLSVSVILIGVSGALIDGSMSIASSTAEIFHQRYQKLDVKMLFKSSMSVVRSILNSTVNTLLFAFISTGLALIFWYQDLDIPWYEMMNSQAFVFEFAVVILSSISVAFILPFTSIITCYYLLKKSS
ncbi:YibE/F family protein [Tetragenococcus halophilus]|uniref:YibE/F family protein n=1 Tax=Tetragenococcus halophilus TaxID=51669 RepID=UPI001B60F0B9|nr:YibE/F family protein [Tetragenococcus halophilus]GFK24322.1 membrane protein [Tetragenococcus halophilus]